MSEYHECEVSMVDQEAIIEALKEMGYQPKIYQNPVNLTGYMGDKRKQKAHIIIPRDQVYSASNDVGFEKQSNGKYKLHISQYDESIASAGKGFQLNKMKQLYAKHRLVNGIKKKAKYKFKSQKTEKDGTIKIQLMRR